MILVCNKYLFSKAIEMKIPEYIQTAGFSRRTWYPEMKLLTGKGTAQHNASKEAVSHRLADKSICIPFLLTHLRASANELTDSGCV